jgi:hypothetical protein
MESFKHKTTGRLSTPETVSLHNLKKNNWQYIGYYVVSCLNAGILHFQIYIIKYNCGHNNYSNGNSVLYPCGKQVLFNRIQSNTLLIKYTYFRRFTLKKMI